MIYSEEIGRVKGHFGPINSLKFHPNGKRYTFIIQVLTVSLSLSLSLVSAVEERMVMCVYTILILHTLSLRLNFKR